MGMKPHLQTYHCAYCKGGTFAADVPIPDVSDDDLWVFVGRTRVTHELRLRGGRTKGRIPCEVVTTVFQGCLNIWDGKKQKKNKNHSKTRAYDGFLWVFFVYIYLSIEWLIFMVLNVGKYTSPMNPMGKITGWRFKLCCY